MIRVMISHDDHVGGSLAGRIGTVGAQGRFLREVALVAQRTIDLVGRYLMVALSWLPRRISLFVLACDPCATGSVQQVLCAQDVNGKEQLWIFYGAVHVRLCGEVHHIVYIILAEQLVGQGAVTNVSFDEDTTFTVDVVFDCAQVACIGEGVEHDDFDLLVLILVVEEIFDEVGADESGSTCHEIGFHLLCLFLIFRLVPFMSMRTSFSLPA